MTDPRKPRSRVLETGHPPVGAPEPVPASGHPRLDIGQVHQTLPQFLDALSDAVLMVDRDHRVVAANRRYHEVFGREEGQVAGEACRRVIQCPDDPVASGQSECGACQVFSNGKAHRLVRTVPDAEGNPRRWEATLNPVLDEIGVVTHVVEVWRDITDRSQLEGQLAHSERLASLGILAAGVAHEINNPMASILTGVESLRRWAARAADLSLESRAEAEEVLEILEGATRRCRETTDKLLLLAQPYETAARWVDLNRTARDTVSLLGYQMRRQGIVAGLELQETLPEIWARESGIRSVCMNLCMNAVQAMPRGGHLTVRTGRSGDRATLTVLDTGPGIPRALLDRIWDPFFTTKPTGQGTGLGLSITSRIVTRHGGTIAVENRSEGGASFRATFPITDSGVDDA